MRTTESRGDLRGRVSRFISIVGTGLIVGLGAVVSLPTRAEIQNDLVGFSTNHVFESGDPGEHIDVMSGNLTLTIPLGPRYKLTDNFGYGVTLYYNSKIWEHECPPDPDDLCHGMLPPYDTYGLGFSLLPGRIYHHADDKDYVLRVQLEDGSDHFFCDRDGPGYTTDAGALNCVINVSGSYTNDTAHLRMERDSSTNVWTATTTDGRSIRFGKLLVDNPDDDATHQALATRIATTALRPNGDPKAWVDYRYDLTDPYRILDIKDSQGRTIDFTYSGWDITITFPAFAGSASYILHRQDLTFRDPSFGIPANSVEHKAVLMSIAFPELNPNTESYRFKYERAGWTTHGWLLQRTLPTGAIVDYYYDMYSTSLFRPYHTELRYKKLTLGQTPTSAGVTFQWSWNRFDVGDPPSPFPPNEDHPPSPDSYRVGTNPYAVKVLDPFNNLTLYEFESTDYNSNSGGNCNVRGECINNWSDGLLKRISTYAGPYPDTAHLVRQVDNTWESETSSNGQHKMFQYRAPAGATPVTAHSMAVNARQLEEKTFIPGNGGNSGRTVTVKSSNWYPNAFAGDVSIRPRQKVEYVDGVLYRSTYTDLAVSAGDWDAHRYVEVKDAAGNVVSRVDRVFTNGQLECEVRRKNVIPTTAITNCGALGLQLGDIATINTFDDSLGSTTATGAMITTKVQGGDKSTTDSRIVSLSYLTYPDLNYSTHPVEKTAYLKTKNYGFSWKAVDREVDFNTGLTSMTRDIAGNTTTYLWDALGRLERITPDPPEIPTVIEYTSLRETKVKQDLGAGNYVESVYHYDDLGRLVRTQRRNAASSYDVQKTEYDIAGRMTRKSEWAPDTTSDANLKWTTYDYTIYTDPDAQPGTVSKHPDPLGRIHGVTTPDDLSPLTPTTETSYSGNTTTVTVRDIQGWVNGVGTNITSTTTYTNDALGRLVAVDAPGSGADARYVYDESDNLTQVRLADPADDPDDNKLQVRRFDYDRLGRLRLAANPENGTVEYTTYDARGNLLQYKDARQNIFKLEYDNADRLLTRKQSYGDNNDRTVLQNTYDANSGHLIQQDSWRIEPNASHQVFFVSRAQFEYGTTNSSDWCELTNHAAGYTGLNGRLTSQTMSIYPSMVNLKTEYCQDLLGMPTKISYPDTTNSGRTRTMVTSTYSNGYLQQLGDKGRQHPYITQINYAAGGVPTLIDRPTVTDSITLDVRNRPSRIQANGHPYVVNAASGFAAAWTGSHQGAYHALALLPDDGVGPEDPPTPGGVITYAGWDSGAYAYDMAGNVTTIGGEEYHYDALSRLVSASIPGVGLTYSLGFAYDGFGNMTSQTRSLSSAPNSPMIRNYVTDWQTNRLTEQHLIGTGPSLFTYDENGNMTSDGGRGFVFDGQGRLREVMDPEKGRIGNYDYDASGYRLRADANGVETFFLRDASGQVLSEFQRPSGTTSTPVWNKDYIYAFGKSFALVKNLTPAAPTRPWATGVTATGLTLNWTLVDAPDIQGYLLERRWKAPGSASEGDPTYISLPASTHSWVDSYDTSGSNAAGDNTYLKYKLTAMDTAGNFSPVGAELVVYPKLQALPPAPAILAPVPGDRSLMVRWNPVVLPNNTLGGYYVERKSEWQTSYVRMNDTLLSWPKLLDSQLLNGHTYWYRVHTVDTSNRESVASAEVSAVPIDNVPPGRLSDVFAEPDRAANRIIISWSRGIDPDIHHYSVYRRLDDVAPSTDSPIGTVPVVAGQESYTFTDTYAPAGTTYYYSVKAVDNAMISNLSAPSDRVSARSRYLVADPPFLHSVSFELNEKGTIGTDGLSGGQNDPNGGSISEEDDDVAQAVLIYSPGSGSGQRVYRKAPDETHFTRVTGIEHGLVVQKGGNVFDDPTITKGEYTYFIAGVNSNGEETAGANVPTSGPDHFVHHTDWDNFSVRNLTVTDGRALFDTDNKHSRFATVKWSRVPQLELVGYNVYRMCSFVDFMETFACEPFWVQLNTTPVPPEQREFQDAGTGGLQGVFFYAVRPVGPNRVEGPIGKIVQANLSTLANTSGEHSDASGGFPRWTLNPWVSPPICSSSPCPYDSPNYVLNLSPGSGTNDPLAINLRHRGEGSPEGAPDEPINVVHYVLDKQVDPASGASKFARLKWAMANPPSDLLGFHVETAGSQYGPWKRLTIHPVAWWERSYVAQGVGTSHYSNANTYSGHSECVRYRVIAVDEDGNESLPVVADNMSSTAICPQTPAPPTNLRASNGTGGSPCATRLEWDASLGATEYYVYRIIVRNDYPYFYDTQRVPAISPQPTSYSYPEIGDWDYFGNNPDHTCGYVFLRPGVPDPCYTGFLEAYYVTALNANVAAGESPGESPRSNLVFWKCVDPPYSKVLRDANPIDAIASMGPQLPGESLACWITDVPSHQRLAAADEERRDTARPDSLAIAPMLRLGQSNNPPWTVLNLHTDHLGSVRMVTDVLGRLVSRHNYFPFGEEIDSPLSHNTHQFTGHERDKETGLDYMLARYYGAGVGRFVSVDPVSKLGKNLPSPQRWNRYGYVLNNPLKYFDPNGEELRLGTGAEKSLAAIQLAVPRADRAAIGSAQDKAGHTVITVDNSHKSSDINFKNVQRAANSPGVVEINQTAPTAQIPMKVNGADSSASLSQIKTAGVTLPSAGTAGDQGKTTVISAQPGVTEVHVDSSISAYAQAPVVAGELAGHAVPGLEGEGATPASDEEHKEREQPAVDQAKINRDGK